MTDSYVWRIKREERTISIEQSDDGVNFSPAGSHTFGPEIDSTIQFFGITGNTHTDDSGYADFDYVTLRKCSPQAKR
jgi:hypothetical protein